MQLNRHCRREKKFKWFINATTACRCLLIIFIAIKKNALSQLSRRFTNLIARKFQLHFSESSLAEKFLFFDEIISKIQRLLWALNPIILTLKCELPCLHSENDIEGIKSHLTFSNIIIENASELSREGRRVKHLVENLCGKRKAEMEKFCGTKGRNSSHGSDLRELICGENN